MSKSKFEIKTVKFGRGKSRILIPVGEISDAEFIRKMDKILTKIVQRMETDKKSS